MEFQLNEYHRDLTTEELINDLIRVSQIRNGDLHDLCQFLCTDKLF